MGRYTTVQSCMYPPHFHVCSYWLCFFCVRNRCCEKQQNHAVSPAVCVLTDSDQYGKAATVSYAEATGAREGGGGGGGGGDGGRGGGEGRGAKVHENEMR